MKGLAAKFRSVENGMFALSEVAVLASTSRSRNGGGFGIATLTLDKDLAVEPLASLPRKAVPSAVETPIMSTQPATAWGPRSDRRPVRLSLFDAIPVNAKTVMRKVSPVLMAGQAFGTKNLSPSVF